MNITYAVLSIILPAICALFVGIIPIFKDDKKRNILTFIFLLATFLTSIMSAVTPNFNVTVLNMTSNLQLICKKDDLTRLFVLLCSFMWLMAGTFSFEYIKHEENHNRFYIYFLLTLTFILLLGYSGNYLTMYLAFEFMTFLSMPLVLHSGTDTAIRAAKKYLYYSILGASLGLINLFFVSYYAPGAEFVAGGVQGFKDVMNSPAYPTVLIVAFLSVVGFGAKAGMFPLHSWLLSAHPVAPAPASAVLSGVITKAGVLCIIRTIFYTYGVNFIKGTWVQYAWIILTLFTVLMGSTLAYFEKIFKKRLAYSSVSQVSYVLFGLAMLTATSIEGAFLHIIFHSLIKDCLFMVAGSIIYKTHLTNVDDYTAIGKKMPITMWCFTIASLSLIGIPPLSGFVSKWYLCIGSLQSSMGIFSILGPIILIVSALLTAGYLFTITIKAFIPGKDFDYSTLEIIKEPKLMTIPMIIITALIIVLGIYPQAIMGLIERIILGLV